MARHWRELSLEDKILRLLNEVTWLIHALSGRRSGDSILIATRRLWYTLGEILADLVTQEEIKQAQQELLEEGRSPPRGPTEP